MVKKAPSQYRRNTASQQQMQLGNIAVDTIRSSAMTIKTVLTATLISTSRKKPPPSSAGQLADTETVF